MSLRDNRVFNPSVSLLTKVASICQHIDEYTGADGHEFDLTAIRALLADPEVSFWLDQMDKLSLLPKKRR